MGAFEDFTGLPIEEEKPYRAAGDYVNLGKMDQDFMGKFDQLASDFQQTYGRPLRIADAWRSTETQAKAYKDWKAGRKQAPIVAAPGTSKHEFGQAIDVHQEDMADLNKLDLSKYGLASGAAWKKSEPWHVQAANWLGPKSAEAGQSAFDQFTGGIVKEEQTTSAFDQFMQGPSAVEQFIKDSHPPVIKSPEGSFQDIQRMQGIGAPQTDIPWPGKEPPPRVPGPGEPGYASMEAAPGGANAPYVSAATPSDIQFLAPDDPLSRINRVVANYRKPEYEIYHGFARSLEAVMNKTGAWGAEKHPITPYTKDALEAMVPSKLIEESGPGEQYIGGLLGGLKVYLAPGIGAGKVMSVLPMSPIIQRLGANLLTFAGVDVLRTIGEGGDEGAAKQAFIQSIPTAALFTVAQSIPFGRLVENPWLMRAMESTATGTAFAGSQALMGDHDPASLSVAFLTGWGLHALTSGLPPNFTEKGKTAALDRYFKEFTVDWQKTYEVSDENMAKMQDFIKGMETLTKEEFDQKEEAINQFYKSKGIPQVDKSFLRRTEKTPVEQNQIWNPETNKWETPDLQLKEPGVGVLYSGPPLPDLAKFMPDSARKILMPTTSQSPEHLQAAQLLGRNLGWMDRANEIALKALNKDRKLLNRLGVQDKNIPLEDNLGIQIMSDLSQGRQVPERFRQYQTVRDKLYDAGLKMLEKAGAALENVRENYFPGMWTTPSRRAFNQAISEGLADGWLGEVENIQDYSEFARQRIRDRVKELIENGQGSDKDYLKYLARRPFKGSESFRKAKTFDDIMTGIEFGLEPLSNNPVELDLWKLNEIHRSAMANAALNEWEAKGDVINVRNDGTPMRKDLRANFHPEEWAKIEDSKYNTIWHQNPDTHLFEKVGNRLAKKPVADIVNNYLSSTLYNHPNAAVRTAYKGAMKFGNFLNQSQLGWGSLFHAGFTTIEAQVSAGAEVIKDIFGNFAGTRTIQDLGQSLKRLPFAWITTGLEGHKVMAEFQEPSVVVPRDIPVGQLMAQRADPRQRVAMLADAVELAGAGFQMESGLRTEQSTKFIQDFFGGRKIKALLRSPVALSEVMMQPIMQLVPRQKAGVFAQMADRIMQQNPGKTMAELTPEFREAWNRVDARLGQVRYNRLFMENWSKNLIQALIRAPGWTGGTITEIAGSIFDTARYLKEWQETGKMPAELPDRTAYTLSLLGTVFLINGVLNKAFTGEWPKGRDWWAFRDGTVDAYGNPNRWLIPSYAKDLFAYYKDWSGTILNKTHPMISLIGELYRGYDYYGTMFKNPEMGFGEKRLAEIIQATKAFEPFWLRGMKKAGEEEGGVLGTLRREPAKIIGPEFGVMPAPRAYTNTPAIEVMNEAARQSGQRLYTPEEAELNTVRRQAQQLMRAGKVDEMVKIVGPVIRDKKISLDKAIDWLMKTKDNPLEIRFKRMNLAWQIKVLDKANPDELQMLMPHFIDKINNPRTKDFDIEKNLPKILNLANNLKKRQQVEQQSTTRPLKQYYEATQ